MFKKKVTGIILAGGKSSRMGTEKGLLKLGGKYMIEYAIDVLKKSCDHILISSNSDQYHFLGYKVVPDLIPESGPMGGIYTGIMHSKNALNVILSCDMPYISQALIDHLFSCYKNHDDVVVPWHGEEKFEPMCALYSQSALKVLEDFIHKGNYKLPDAYKVLNTNKVSMDDSLSFYSKKLFQNINAKTDYKMAEQDFKLDTEKWNNMILIAGTGRNVGKTSLACRLIEQTSLAQNVVAIKISPHMHTQSESAKLLTAKEEFSIYKEEDQSKFKDSSRMLQAGASKVFYIQSEEKAIGEAFHSLQNYIDKDNPIICESGGLRNFIQPALFIICKHESKKQIKSKAEQLMELADLIVHFKGSEFNIDVRQIKFADGKWSV